MRPVFLGIAAAVMAYENNARWHYSDDFRKEPGSPWWSWLNCKSGSLVRMNIHLAERRDAERMAWMGKLKAENPGMYCTRRYVAEVLPMVTGEMHQRARS